MKIVDMFGEPKVYIMPTAYQKILKYIELSKKKRRSFYCVGNTVYNIKKPGSVYVCSFNIIPQKSSLYKPDVEISTWREYFNKEENVDEANRTKCVSNVVLFVESTEVPSSRKTNFTHQEIIELNSHCGSLQENNGYLFTVYANQDGSVKFNCVDTDRNFYYEDVDFEVCYDEKFTLQVVEEEYDSVVRSYFQTTSYNSSYGSSYNCCSTYNYNSSVGTTTTTHKSNYTDKDFPKSQLIEENPDIKDII